MHYQRLLQGGYFNYVRTSITLEQASGINEAMLFPDLDGFVRLHREGMPYTEPSASDYFNRAMQVSGEEAILNYDKAIDLDPQNPELYEWRAGVKIQLGRDQEAIDDYNKMIELDPCAHSYDKLGKAFLRVRRPQQAFALFGKMIELFPDAPFGYTRRGKANYELGQYQEAIIDLNTALQVDPNDISTYRLRGKINEQIGNLHAAKEDFQKALTLLPSNAMIRGEIKVDLQQIEKKSQKGNKLCQKKNLTKN